MAKLNKLRGKQGNSSVGPQIKKNAHLVVSSPASNFKGTLNKSSSNRLLKKNTNSVEKVYTKNFMVSLGGIGPNMNKKTFNVHKGSVISSN
jgi:hypothetical protein